MRTLRADFVDAAVDGPSEIKLSGTDLRRSFRTADLRQERACRIKRGQKLDHAAATSRSRLGFSRGAIRWYLILLPTRPEAAG